MRGLPRPVHQEQINIFGPQICEGFVQRTLHILWPVLRVPQLPGDKDILPLDTTLLYSHPDFVLISIDGCAIDVTISRLQGNLDRFLDLVRSGLPCAKAYGWYFCPGVEREATVERHACGFDVIRDRGPAGNWRSWQYPENQVCCLPSRRSWNSYVSRQRSDLPPNPVLLWRSRSRGSQAVATFPRAPGVKTGLDPISDWPRSRLLFPSDKASLAYLKSSNSLLVKPIRIYH